MHIRRSFFMEGGFQDDGHVVLRDIANVHLRGDPASGAGLP